MRRKAHDALLSDPYTTEAGQSGRAFYAGGFGFGKVETQEDDGLGNVRVSFADIEPLDGETSVVAGSIFRTEDPRLDVLQKKGVQSLIRAGKIAVGRG